MKMLKSKDLDFLAVVKKETSRSDPDHAKKTMMVFIPTVALAVFVIIAAYFQYSTIALQAQINDYDKKIFAIQQSEEYQLVNAGMKILETTDAFITNSRKMVAVKNSFPVTDSKTIQTLQDNCPEGTKINTISYISGYAFLIVTGETDQPEKVADYTANLRATGAYVQLREEKYEKAGDGEEDTTYSFTIYTNLTPGISILDLEGMVVTDDIQ